MPDTPDPTSADGSLGGASMAWLDAPVPREMAHRAETIGVAKAGLSASSTIALGVLAGAFISIGAMFFTVVTAGGDLPFGVSRLLSSTACRCSGTLRPYAAARGLSLRLKDGLSEEGFTVNPERAVHHLRRAVERGASTALCTHGPVLPSLLEALRHLVDVTGDGGPGADALLRDAADRSLAKGEVIVCHVAGTGDAARIVAVEGHRS